jgi:hypothetical protein
MVHAWQGRLGLGSAAQALRHWQAWARVFASRASLRCAVHRADGNRLAALELDSQEAYRVSMTQVCHC